MRNILARPGLVLSAFYDIIEKFILSFQGSLNCDQSFCFQMQKACPKFKVDLLCFRSLVIDLMLEFKEKL